MKENKSIDGLTTRSAKKPHTSASSKNKAINKPVKTPKAKTITVEAPTEPLVETSIDESITVKDTTNSALSMEELAAAFTDSTPESPLPQDTSKDNAREDAIADFLNPIIPYVAEEPKKSKLSRKDKKSMKAQKSSIEEKPKKTSKARRIITTILLIIVLGLIGLVIWGVFWGNDIIAKLTGGQGNIIDALTFIDDTYEPLKTDANGRTNILAFGTSGYDMSGDEGDGPHAGAQLTDSIMAISLNQETGDIVMISLPRDLKASPTCTATGKINEVYWCNGGGADISSEQEAEAAQALMDEVGSILGIDFQYYAHLNWGALVDIVDTLGGITVTLDEDIDDDWWTGAVYEAGVPYTLNGEEALGLARARHGTMGGDFSRGASQQKILIGIKDKIFEKDLSITDILSLASTLGDNLRTNFTLSDMKTLAHLTWEFDFNNMRQVSLLDYANGVYLMTTGTLDNGISYVFPRAGVDNYDDIIEYVALHLSNDPRDYEDPYILVLNASDEAGLASTEEAKLEKEGYTHVTADNAPEGVTYETGTTLYVVNDKKPGSLKLLETLYNTEASSNLPEGVTRDYDFVIILNPEKKTTE
ncbi:LCP family protein [Candidatus Saccharibacteria bacterium]|nr:LCP family protein [Candidatus Saccharibacteria bacterium]